MGREAVAECGGEDVDWHVARLDIEEVQGGR
jgi:hypothetical protein